MSVKPELTRRQFLKASGAAGASLVIAIYLGGCRPAEPPAPAPTAAPTEGEIPTTPPTATPDSAATLEPNIYLRIDSDGKVTITAFRSEMGQGIRTAIAMIVADELDVDWQVVRVEQAPADPAYGDQVTGGSASVNQHYSLLRRAGADARHLLVTAAAQFWGVETQACSTHNGLVIHPDGQQNLAYAELVAAAAELPLPKRGESTLKESDDFRLIGTEHGNFDNAQFVTGRALYGIDIKLPGMLYASVVQCPVFGGELLSFDADAALAIPGVRQVFEISSGLAVVAEHTWAALQGAQALEITWDEGDNTGTSSQSLVQSRLASAQERIDAYDADIFAQIYTTPYLAHATMEPMNCTVDLQADRCQVWAPTQNAQAAKRQVRMLVSLPDEAITVHIPLIGGGFGRRLEVDYVRQAVEIAKEIQNPVQLVWSRAEDIQHDFYHPLGVHLVNASRSEPRLPAPNSQQAAIQIPTGAWRSVSNFHAALARECFIDELAHELGRDPLELRRQLYPEALLPVLELVAEKSGWGQALAPGHGRGLACYSTFNVTHVAQVAEVRLDDDGNIKVLRVVCAVECGQVVNPDGVRAQMEGGIVFGLTAALKSGINIENGRVKESNFHDYPPLRLDEMPAIETYLVPSSAPPTGIGEMGVPPAAPAVLNAIFAASGIRIRHIPVRPQDLKH